MAKAASLAEIRKLDIGPPPLLNESSSLQESGGAAVVAGCIVGFVPGLDATSQRDVLESLLLAQLAANSKADRYKAPAEWFSAYRGVLEQIALVVETGTSLSRYLPQVSRFRVDTIIADVLRPKLAQAEWEAVQRSLHALGTVGTAASPAVQVFECPSHSGGLGNFQVAVASNVDDDLRLCIAQVMFNVNRHVTRLMSEEFTSHDQNLQVGFLALHQNEEIYHNLRSGISAKVQGRFDRSVVTVPV